MNLCGRQESVDNEPISIDWSGSFDDAGQELTRQGDFQEKYENDEHGHMPPV